MYAIMQYAPRCSLRVATRVQEEGLRQQLQGRLRELSDMDVEDLSAVQEELGLVELLLGALQEAAAGNCLHQPWEAAPSGKAGRSSLQLAAV